MAHPQHPEVKQLTRGEFLTAGAAALLAFSAAGCLLGCATKKDPETTDGKNFSGSLTLSTDQKSTLDSQGFLNLDGLLVIKDGATYRAYGRRCPHQGGEVNAQSATSLQCSRHTDQFYNKLGQGNGAQTSATLTTYTVTDNSGTITITG